MNCSAGRGPAAFLVLQPPPAEARPPERPGAGGEPVAPTTSNTWNGMLRSGRGAAECACARRRRDPGRVPGWVPGARLAKIGGAQLSGSACAHLGSLDGRDLAITTFLFFRKLSEAQADRGPGELPPFTSPGEGKGQNGSLRPEIDT